MLKILESVVFLNIFRLYTYCIYPTDGIMLGIVDAQNIAQLEDNIKSTTFLLSADDLARIDAVSVLTNEYPSWMAERQLPERKV